VFFTIVWYDDFLYSTAKRTFIFSLRNSAGNNPNSSGELSPIIYHPYAASVQRRRHFDRFLKRRLALNDSEIERRVIFRRKMCSANDSLFNGLIVVFFVQIESSRVDKRYCTTGSSILFVFYGVR